MSFRLDHVVIAVADLERAMQDYRALGFTVEPGGRHPGRTSQNALVVFADGSYLELIAWPQPGPAERWYNVLAKHGEGLMDFALIPDDVPRAIVAARSRGLALNGPVEGARVRPDGRELKWRTGRQTTFDLPFLCGDVTPREWRVPAGEARHHANGAVGIAAVTVAVADLEASLGRYDALLGPEAALAPVEIASDVDGISVRLGETAILLVSPSDEGASSPTATALRERLATRGQGPWRLAIRTEATPPAPAPDPKLTHGVALRLTAAS